MRVLRGWCWCSAAIVALCAWASPVAVAAEPAPSVEIVGATTPELLAKPLEVALKPPPGEEPGVLQVPLVAREKGSLEVQFIDSKTGKEVAIGAASEAPETPEVTGYPTEVQLTVGQLYLLRLVFTPSESEPEALGGILKVGIAGGLPITRTVTATTRKKGWFPAQKKVEVVSTNLLPSLFFDTAPDRSRTIGVRPEEAGVEAPEKPLAERYVAFGDSGNATVTVGAPESVEDPASSQTSQRSKISVTGVSGVGTATTVVDLGSEAKPSQEVEIIVQARDSIWIPLLVIVIGAFLGKLLPTWWDSRRQGKLVGKDLEEAVDEYRAASGPDGNPDDDGPADLLQPLDDRLCDFEQLRKELEHVNSGDTLEKRSAAAQEASDRIHGWLAVHKALRNLAKAVKGTEPLLARVAPSRARPYLDAKEILGRAFEVTPDLSQSEGWASAFTQQAEALEQYAAVYAAARGEDDESERLVRMALSVYLESGPPLTRTPEKGRLMVEQLRQIHGWLPAEPAPGRLKRFAEVTLADMPEGLSLGAAIEFATRGVLGLIWPRAARSPEDVMSEVRHGDWAVFTIVLVVSAVAYLLPVYSAGPFGTPLQYLAAFVAGAGGQVVITGVAVPIARSLKAKAGADEGKGDAPAAPAAATT